MKASPDKAQKRNQGLTLIELTIVVLALLTLISLLFMGAKAYKEGSDRASCILNQRHIQTYVRSYQNMWGLSEGDTLDESVLFGAGALVGAAPECPSGGNYDLIDTIPGIGVLVYPCDLAASREHSPANISSW